MTDRSVQEQIVGVAMDYVSDLHPDAYVDAVAVTKNRTGDGGWNWFVEVTTYGETPNYSGYANVTDRNVAVDLAPSGFKDPFAGLGQYEKKKI
jgi:hypothetical protein